MNRPIRAGAIFIGGAIGATLGLTAAVFIQEKFTPDAGGAFGTKIRRLGTFPKIAIPLASGLLGAIGVGMLALPKTPRRRLTS